MCPWFNRDTMLATRRTIMHTLRRATANFLTKIAERIRPQHVPFSKGDGPLTSIPLGKEYNDQGSH